MSQVIDAESRPVKEEAPDPLVGDDGIKWGDAAPPAEPHLPARAADAHVDRLAEEALTLPSVVPGKEELLTLAMEARMLAYGNLVPKDVRGKPADVLLILLVGRDLGIAQTSALQQVYVVDGKPSLAPKLLNARLRKLHLGGIYPHPNNSRTWAGALVLTWEAVRKVEGVELNSDGKPWLPVDLALATVEFSWDDAKQAGLVSANCEPGAHAQGNACRCKDNWKKYPQRMVWWRASGYAADDYFPEASLGLYSPDELGAVTNEDGQPIDVHSVEVPDGFVKGARGDGGGEDNTRATPEERWTLQERIQALPDEQKADLRKRWSDLESLRSPNGRPYPPFDLPARLLSLVNSLLNGVEAQARSKGWDGEVAVEAVRAEVAETAGDLLRGLLLLSVLPPWPETATGATESADEAPSATGSPTSEPEPESGPETQPTADEPIGADPAIVQEVVDEVEAMSDGEVDATLKLWTLPRTGGKAGKRQRLVQAKVRDRLRTDK